MIEITTIDYIDRSIKKYPNGIVFRIIDLPEMNPYDRKPCENIRYGEININPGQIIDNDIISFCDIMISHFMRIKENFIK